MPQGRDKKLYIDKEHFYTFRICPLLKIINKKSMEIWIWWSWLQYFRDTEKENIWFKKILYNVRSFSNCVMPPYYTIPNTTYIDLEKMAVNSNYEEAMNILKVTNDFILI